MIKNEISEFISKSIEQVKTGLPKNCVLNGNFDFDISLATEITKDGKIGIHIAGVGGSSSSQVVHRFRFSITDKESRDMNCKYFIRLIKDMASELPEIVE